MKMDLFNNKGKNILNSFVESDIIEKAKAYTPGTIRKYGGKDYIKVTDMKGVKWNDQWKMVSTPKQIQEVMKEFGSVTGVTSKLSSISKKKGPIEDDSIVKKRKDESFNDEEILTDQEVGVSSEEDIDPLVKALNNVAQSDHSPLQKFVNMYSYGIIDPKTLAANSGLPYSEVLRNISRIEKEAKESLYTEAEKNQIAAAIRQKRLDLFAELAGISIKDRWNTYKVILDNTIGGSFKSMVVYGSGGVGKTFNMQKRMKNFVVHRQTGEIISKAEFSKKFGAEAKYDPSDIRFIPENDWRELRQYDPTKGFGKKDYEYVVLGGSITPIMTYASTYQHNGKILVFDDIDKVLKDKEGLDVIKGALDGEIKDISWASSGKPKDMLGEEVPKTFKFKGKAIFITNLTEKQLRTPELQPITQSRAEPVNLTMTKDETIEQLQSLVDTMEVKDSAGNVIDATPEDVQIALDYMVEMKDLIHPGYFNARKLGALTKLLKIAGNDVKVFRIMASSSLDVPTGSSIPEDWSFDYE